MGETRIDMRAAGHAHRDSTHQRMILPLAWFRRRKTLLTTLLLLACVCMWLWIAMPDVRVPVLWGASRARIDPDIRELLRKTPGAIPGVPSGPDEPVGRNGTMYPSRRDLTTMLLEHLRDPSFHLEQSVWKSWSSWIGSDAWPADAWPADAYIQFLTELKRMNGGDLSDIQRYLHSPMAWELYHLQLEPLTVFSKSFCPYSRAAKNLLNDYHANFTKYEVDLRHDAMHLAPLLWALTGHRTYPKVLTGSNLVGGFDTLQDLHDRGLLEGVLHGAGAL
ncbi:hypothetical protein MNAN1_002630 [Malassezia nana]|uniref:Glutaredoxin domain-containing protein n=1 Tax=Malassezia nana TaxID=180528 RepID=A0AAF0EN33_9BASI|nr:hypothetical protein MNAN1_002630 [Malassezia nana]